MPALSLPSLAIFANPLYTRFLIGRWFATLAIQIQATAMGWQVYDAAREHGQSVAEAAFVLGLVGLAQFLPLLVLSLFGALCGVLLCHLAALLLRATVEDRTGVYLDWTAFAARELYLVLAVGALGAAAGLLPAIKGSCTQVADNLSQTY